MGIFSRFRDIVSANINAMLDKAEDPEKLVKLMIREMEDTLVDMKAACAGAMASRSRIGRTLAEAESRSAKWNQKAELAISKGREDLAREALLQKRRYQSEIAHLEAESTQVGELVTQYQEDIAKLEEKLESARKKHRSLVQRHVAANRRKESEEVIRRASSEDAITRFDRFENRIERMEAGADLVNAASKPTLDEEFERLQGDQELEKELAELKRKVGSGSDRKPDSTPGEAD